MSEKRSVRLTAVLIVLWVIFFALVVASYRLGIPIVNDSYPDPKLVNRQTISRAFPMRVIVPEKIEVVEVKEVKEVKVAQLVKPKQVSRGSDSMNLRATAYTLSVESCGKSRSHPDYGVTASGKKATVGRTVAVDPTLIPLRSLLYIEFPEPYTHLSGEYVADDVGGDIKGYRIDIFMGLDENKARIFGNRRIVKVRIIERR